jgi:hypothetical protein
MEWLLIAAAVAVVLVAARPVLRWRDRRLQARAEVAAVRRLAEEDIALLGGLLDELDRHLTGYALDGPAKEERQRARDAYAAATAAAGDRRTVPQAKPVAEKVCEGRYALECVKARVADRPLPARATPCFFDPRHGLADQDVLWTRPAHGSHRVPACAADSARVTGGERPLIRTVEVRGRTMPYWEAGAAALGYCDGCFGSTIAFQAGPAGRRWSVNPFARAYDTPGLVLSPHAPGQAAPSSAIQFGGGGSGDGGCGGGGGGSC